MTPRYRIRQATHVDADLISGHRVCMFREMGEVPTDDLATGLFDTSSSALRQLLREGTYVGWIALDSDDRPIGGVGAHVKSQLPRVSHDRARLVTAPAPLVVNMYMEAAWRRQGIARTLMTTLMNWATARGFDRLVLHASDAGRPLYESLGFVPTNEMRWSPNPQDKPGSRPSGR